MSKNEKKEKSIEYYPVYKPTIRVSLPEFLDALQAFADTPDFLDKEVEIARDSGWAFYELAMQIEEEPTRSYYVEVVRKWLQSVIEPKKGD